MCFDAWTLDSAVCGQWSPVHQKDRPMDKTTRQQREWGSIDRQQLLPSNKSVDNKREPEDPYIIGYENSRSNPHETVTSSISSESKERLWRWRPESTSSTTTTTHTQIWGRLSVIARKYLWLFLAALADCWVEHYDGWKSRLVVAVILSSRPSPSKRTKEETTREWREKKARDATAFNGKWKTFSSSFFSFDAIKGHDSLVSMFHARTDTHTHTLRESNQVKWHHFSIPPPPFLPLIHTHTKKIRATKESRMECFILSQKEKKMKINSNFRLTFYTEKGRRHYHIFQNRKITKQKKKKKEMKFDCVFDLEI